MRNLTPWIWTIRRFCFFTITEEVDKYIRQQIAQSYPQESYVFDRWIDNSTVMLKSINTNTANGSFLVI